MDISTLLTIILPPVTALCGWLAGTRKRKNDAIAYMQKTIDDLAAKNAEYLAEITTLRKQVADLAADNTKLQHGQADLSADNAKLQQGQAEMQAKLDEIGRENAALRNIIEKRAIPAKTKRNGTL